MSEYIYGSIGDPLANALCEIYLPRAEIVRCRDCGHSTGEGTCCWHFAYDELDGFNDWVESPADVEPNGFCAWATRREP